MKIFDLFVIPYYILFRNAKQNQIEASVFAANMSPLTFYTISLIFFIRGIFFEQYKIFHPIVAIILLGLIYFLYERILNKYYLTQRERLNKICDRLEPYKYFFILVIAIYFFSCVFLFVYSMKYGIHLKEGVVINSV
jgi:hypothetical protein